MATAKRLLDEARLERASLVSVEKVFERSTRWEGVKIGHYRVLPGQIPVRTSRTNDVFVPLSGAVTIEGRESNGAVVPRRRTVGEISVTPIGATYSAHWKEELEYLCVYFTEDFLRRATVDFEANQEANLVLSCGPRDPLVRSIAHALADELASEQPAGKLYAESLVNALVVHLMRHYSTDALVPDLAFGGLPQNKLRRVTEFIEENLDQDLELATLAREADLSPYHFARSFKQSVGMPPIQFLMERRVERAKLLLHTSDLPLSEIALRVGFKNQSHFTTLFRKYTDMTPKAWRTSRQR